MMDQSTLNIHTLKEIGRKLSISGKTDITVSEWQRVQLQILFARIPLVENRSPGNDYHITVRSFTTVVHSNK